MKLAVSGYSGNIVFYTDELNDVLCFGISHIFEFLEAKRTEHIFEICSKSSKDSKPPGISDKFYFRFMFHNQKVLEITS